MAVSGIVVEMPVWKQEDDESKDTDWQKGNMDDDNLKEAEMEKRNMDDDEEAEIKKVNQVENQRKEVSPKLENKYMSETVKIESNIKNARWGNDKVTCPECGNNYFRKNLKQHTLNVHVERSKNQVNDFVCDTCPNSFRKYSYLRQHQKSVHSSVRKFSCLICSKGCVSKGELVTHMKCHTKQRDFICDKCSETFITKSCLKAHTRKHDGTMLQCQTCGKQFPRVQHLNVHVKYVHLKASTSVRSERRRILKRLRVVKPSPTDLSLATKLYIKNLEMNLISDETEDNKVKCLECGKNYSRKSLKEHLLNVHVKKSKNQTVEKQPQDNFLNFLTKVNAEFSGPELALVLSFVKDLREKGNTEQITNIIEDLQNESYRHRFEDLGVLPTKPNIQTEYISITEALPEFDIDNKEETMRELNLDDVIINDTNINGSPTSKINSFFSKGTQFVRKKKEKGTAKKPKRRSIKKEGSPTSVIKESKICPICNKIFKKVSKKKYHMLIHTKLFKNLSIDDKIYWSEDRTTLSCRDCGKEFNQHSHMKVHIARAHYQLHNLESLNTLDSSEIVEKVKKIDCDLKKTSQYQCMECGKMYNDKTGLRRHGLVHTGERPYPCDKCDKKFRQKPTLDKHKKMHNQASTL